VSGQKHGVEKAAVMVGCSFRFSNLLWHASWYTCKRFLVNISAIVSLGQVNCFTAVSQLLCPAAGLLRRIFTVVIFLVQYCRSIFLFVEKVVEIFANWGDDGVVQSIKPYHMPSTDFSTDSS
jgi:hypothetical protein